MSSAGSAGADQGRAAPVVRPVRGEREVTDVGALTAEAYHADGLLDEDDGYAAELADAARRAREATLLVAVVPRHATGTPDDDVVVGSLTLAPYGSSYAEVAGPDELELRMLAVAPEARRRGVAQGLLEAAMREAVAGGRRLVLSTLDAMETAQRLYRRLGFVPEPDRDWAHEEVRLRVWTWSPPARPGALVEAATWPPLRTVDVDGWTVGLSGGFSRRANSVLAMRPPVDVPRAIERVEELYGQEGLPAVVRVDDLSRPADLEARLRARDYRPGAFIWVLVRDASVAGLAIRVHASATPDAEWWDCWWATTAVGPARDAARAVVTAAPARYLSVRDAGGAAGVVRVAVAQEWAGLSCLAVAPRARGAGLGRELVQAALREASAEGARHAFVQVEESDTASLRLHGALGFHPADRYRYLEGPAPTGRRILDR